MFKSVKDAIEMRQATESAREANFGDGILRFREPFLRLGNATGLDETHERDAGRLSKDMGEVCRGKHGVTSGGGEGERGIVEVGFDKLTATTDFGAFQLCLQIANCLGALAELPRKQFEQSHDADELWPWQIDCTVIGGTQSAIGDFQPSEPFSQPAKRGG